MQVWQNADSFIGNSMDAKGGRATNIYVYHMQVHCHSSMPIKSLAEAQLIWREKFTFSLAVQYNSFEWEQGFSGMLKNKFASKY